MGNNWLPERRRLAMFSIHGVAIFKFYFLKYYNLNNKFIKWIIESLIVNVKRWVNVEKKW